MRKISFEIAEDKLLSHINKFPNMGKNSDVGKLAIEIVKEYFLSLDSKATFIIGKNGIDIQVTHLGITEDFEVKGTAGSEIAWAKLKVSSQNCHNQLTNGMQIIRVANVGKTKMFLHFMECGKDFNLVPEPRWALKPVKQSKLPSL